MLIQSYSLTRLSFFFIFVFSYVLSSIDLLSITFRLVSPGSMIRHIMWTCWPKKIIVVGLILTPQTRNITCKVIILPHYSRQIRVQVIIFIEFYYFLVFMHCMFLQITRKCIIRINRLSLYYVRHYFIFDFFVRGACS